MIYTKYILLFLLMPCILLAQVKKDTIRVFYLGGQSNMQGYGYVKELPDSLNNKNKKVGTICYGKTTKIIRRKKILNRGKTIKNKKKLICLMLFLV